MFASVILCLTLSLTPTSCTKEQAKKSSSLCQCFDRCASDYKSCLSIKGELCESKYKQCESRCRDFWSIYYR